MYESLSLIISSWFKWIVIVCHILKRDAIIRWSICKEYVILIGLDLELSTTAMQISKNVANETCLIYQERKREKSREILNLTPELVSKNKQLATDVLFYNTFKSP